jgi:hypothetical protein
VTILTFFISKECNSSGQLDIAQFTGGGGGNGTVEMIMQDDAIRYQTSRIQVEASGSFGAVEYNHNMFVLN